MAGKKGTKAMNAADFKKIKDLQSYGLKPRQIIEIVGRSHSTISRVSKATSYDEYVTGVKALRKDWQAKQEAKKNNPVYLIDLAKDVRPTQVNVLEIRHITNNRNTVFGLGADNKVYVWERKANNWVTF